MRKVLLMALLVSLFHVHHSDAIAKENTPKSPTPAHTGGSARNSQGGDFGIGVILGEPTGFSAKKWLDGTHAVDFGLAYSFGNSFTFLSDYLWHFPGFFGRSSEFSRNLSAYLGVGGTLLIFSGSHWHGRYGHKYDSGSLGLGLRIPFGAEWMIPSTPLGLSLELVPGMLLAPETDVFVQGGVALRFYF